MDTRTTLDGTLDLERYAALLDELEAAQDGPIVSGSFDLRPDDTGVPTVIHLLRQAARESLPPDTTDSVLEKLVEDLREALESAATEGHVGVFLAGPMEAPATHLAPSRVPPRNRLWVGERATRFELERSRAALRTRVAAIAAERGRLRWALIEGHGDPQVGELETDDHYMRGAVGRTGQHDRGGSATTPAGGHSKSRIESSAEEERDRFAREAAEDIEQQLGDAAVVLLSGPPEFTARLSAHLSGPLRERVEEVDLEAHATDVQELLAMALERAVQAQYERAASLSEEILSGAHGERAASGNDEILAAIEQGRLQQLVLDEDAAGHYGDAIDARAHAGVSDAQLVEDLLINALRQSATVWFRRDEGADDAPLTEPVGLLRW